MSSDGNIYKRIFDLLAAIFKMVVDGKRDAEEVAEALQRIVDGSAKMVNTYLRQFFVDLVVDVLDGTRTFANSGFVIGYINPEYKPTARPTSKIVVSVFEMIKDGIFAVIFGGLGGDRQRFETEHQVVEFCEKHRSKLRPDGHGTFFELEGGFVADVRVDASGRLSVGVYSLGFGSVWRAECRHRVVVPQQTPVPSA